MPINLTLIVELRFVQTAESRQAQLTLWVVQKESLSKNHNRRIEYPHWSEVPGVRGNPPLLPRREDPTAPPRWHPVSCVRSPQHRSSVAYRDGRRARAAALACPTRVVVRQISAYPEQTVRTFVRTFVSSHAKRRMAARRYRFCFQQLMFFASRHFAYKFGC